MVFGLGGSGGGKKGGGKDDQGKGKGQGNKRAASKSASPPQPSQRRQTTAGGSIASPQQPIQRDARMAVGALVNARAQTPALPSRQGTGGSSSAAATSPPAPPPIQPGILLPKPTKTASRAKLAVKGMRDLIAAAKPNEFVWYCCQCLCNRRESPPEYNQQSLVLCWWLRSEANTVYGPLAEVGRAGIHYCGHKKCDGCVRQKRNVPAPIWVLMYAHNLTKVIWRDGPWPNRYEAFRPYERPPPGSSSAITPPWWCCECVASATKSCLKVRTGHWCQENRGGKRCYHFPCKQCWEYAPPGMGVKKPQQRLAARPTQQQPPPRQQPQQQPGRDRRSKSKSKSQSPGPGEVVYRY